MFRKIKEKLIFIMARHITFKNYKHIGLDIDGDVIHLFDRFWYVNVLNKEFEAVSDGDICE